MLENLIIIDGVEYTKTGWPDWRGAVKTSFSRSRPRIEKCYAQRRIKPREVFIKKATTPGQKTVIWREYIALKRLQSWSPLGLALPCVVPRILQPLNDDGMTSDMPLYLVTERLGVELSGEKRFISLLEYVEKNGLLGQQEWKLLTRALFKVLSYLHNHGVYHCDLTPEHVWVRSDFRAVKLVDFSLAFCRQATDFEYGGTDTYAAPEIYQSVIPFANLAVFTPIKEEYLDSFSAWATLYFARTGRHYPLEGYLWAALDKSHITENEKEMQKHNLEIWVKRQIQNELPGDIAIDPLLNAMVKGLEPELNRRGGGIERMKNH
jgi:serine/threonine protein kinase